MEGVIIMNSDISQIFEICIIPILGVLTGFIIKFINVKSNELTAKTNNEIAQKYTLMIANTIKHCVETTNQTYVDSLKKQSKFDEQAQKEAFQKTLNAVIASLSLDAIKYINETTRDMNTYLTQLIESTVKSSKK